MGLSCTLTRKVRVHGEPELLAPTADGTVMVTGYFEEIYVQGFELMEAFFNALEGYHIESDGDETGVGWDVIARFWLALLEWKMCARVKDEDGTHLENVDYLIHRMAPWMGHGEHFHKRFGISENPGDIEPYGWTEFTYRGEQVMDPITLTFAIMIVFSLTGHLPVPWYWLVAIYVILVALAWMTTDEE